MRRQELARRAGGRRTAVGVRLGTAPQALRRALRQAARWHRRLRRVLRRRRRATDVLRQRARLVAALLRQQHDVSLFPAML